MFSAPCLRSRGCILVVDDQLANIRTVGSLLHAEGYDVMSAISAEQALQRMRARRPDLVLLDMMMPGTSGLDLCGVLASETSLAEVPVIFLSAADESGLITAALEAGAVDYVTKPFRGAELLSRIRTHLALKAARDKLQSLAEEKDELLRLMAHDLKNGLAAVRMHTEYLSRHVPCLEPDVRQCVKTISHEAIRLSECIGELLASQARGPRPIHLTTVDLGAIAREAVDAYRQLAAAKNQKLTLEYCAADPCLVRTDRTALRQIIDNLLSNAITFSLPGSPIQVRVSAAGNGKSGGCISIRDTGPGFTQEDRKRLFKGYGRLSACPTGGETSTGLGLIIVKKLVDRLGSTLLLETEPGRGSFFKVQLPPA